MSAHGSRGFSLAGVLAGLCLLTLGAIAATGMVLAASRSARQSAFEGRRAVAAMRAADRVRGGLTSGDSGSFVVTVAGDSFLAAYERYDSLVPGALRIEVRPSGGAKSLVFGAAAPLP